MRRLLLGATAAALVVSSGSAAPPAAGTPIAAEQEPFQTVQAAAHTDNAPKHRPSVRDFRALYPNPIKPRHLDLWRFHAPIVRVHTTGTALVPPADPSVLGWWGRRAGARHGTTLIVGHSVHTGGGELDTLSHTPIGSVARVSGVRYRVTSVRVMPKPQLARRAPHMFRQDGPPRLVVVSCASYDWATHTWPANAVVTATREVGSHAKQ